MATVELLLDISSDEMNNIINDYTTNTSITRTDREIFYSDIFYKEGDRWEDKVSTIENFVLIDEYLEYLNYLSTKNTKSNSKIIEKSIMRKKLEFQSIITDFTSMTPITVRKNRNNFIINRKSISVPFPVKAYIDNKEFLLAPSTNITIDKFKIRPIFSLDKKNKFYKEINQNLKGINLPSNINLQTEEGTLSLISTIVKHIANADIANKYNETIKHMPVYSLKVSNEFKGDKNVSLMEEFNKFLTFKLFNTNILNMYNSFDIDNKINIIEKILVDGEKGSSNKIFIKNLINSKLEEDKYNKAVSALIKQQSKISRLEFLCKKKFPNLFNKNSKELLFNEKNRFSLDALPIKYNQALLTEYKLRESYEEKIITSKCGHKQAIQKLKISETNFNPSVWESNLKWVNKEVESGFHNCVSCSLPAMCNHEYFLYSNYYSEYKKGAKAEDIRKIINITTNKFMISGGAKGFAYCKFCGEELSNSKDEENVIGYDDGINMYNNKDRERDPLEIFIYFVVVRNIFIASSSPYLLSNIVNTIWKTINPIVATLKKKKKIKKGESFDSFMDKNMELNIVIMVIVSIMILSLKYNFIGFKSMRQNIKPIIVSRNEKDKVKLKFKEAFDVFSNNYTNLLKQTNYIDKVDTLKELFVKVYSLIKSNLEESISISEDNISQFINEGVAEEFLKIISSFSKTSVEFRKNIYSIPVVNYIKNKYSDLKIGSRQGPGNTNLWNLYKESSYNVFSKFFEENLYERYHDDRLNEEWDVMIFNNKKIENDIKEINILKTLYPYGHIPYSYERYFKGNKWGNDMGLYACIKTGKKHVWGSYLFKNKKNNLLDISIKDISSNLEIISESNIYAIKCKECKMNTEELKNPSMGEKTLFENVVEYESEINSFYIVFKYRCLIPGGEMGDFHNFVGNKDIKCNKCNLYFKDIRNKNKDFYKNNIENYTKYKENINKIKNENIKRIKEENDNIFSLDYKKIEVKNINLSMIKEIKENTLLDKMNYLNINNNSILSITGETENVKEEDLFSRESDEKNNNLNDIFLKIVDRIREICVFVGILANNPTKHKYTKNIDFINLSSKISSNNEIIKINQYIIDKNFINTCWEYRNSKGVPEGITFAKSSLYEILLKVKDLSFIVYEYILEKLETIDILYTSFNYADIKKTFNINKIIEDDFSSSIDGEYTEIENDSELFDSSDLSMNNFEDDDLDNDS